MPIYEYRCNDCGAEFSELVEMDGENPDCPGCKSKSVVKLISVTAGTKPSCEGCTSSSCSSCGGAS